MKKKQHRLVQIDWIGHKGPGNCHAICSCGWTSPGEKAGAGSHARFRAHFRENK